VLVVGPPGDAPPATGEDIDALLRAALERLSVREAAAEIAAITGTPKREIYARALDIEKNKI
jgi:16S rRNA (cytidine1402-2'-O)-methyltransferase